MDKMPEKIWVTPRGSGTISGVYVDMPLGDEERGEHEYTRADLPKEVDLGELKSMELWAVDPECLAKVLDHLVALGVIKDGV